MYFGEPENHTNHVLPYFLVTKPKKGEFPLPTLNGKKTWLLLPDLRLLFKSRRSPGPLYGRSCILSLGGRSQNGGACD